MNDSVFELFIWNILTQFSFCQDWLAFVQAGVQLTFQGKLQFENGGAPLEQDNFAFCKVRLLFFSKVETNQKKTILLQMVNSF